MEWLTKIAQIDTNHGCSITTDSINNVIVVGFYTGMATNIYNADGTVALTLNNSGRNNTFIAKYNTNGMLIWATRIGGPGSSVAYRVSSDSLDNIIVVGTFSINMITIYNANGFIAKTIPLIGTTNSFIVKYDTNGNMIWSTSINSTSSNQTDVELFGLATDRQNSIVVTGYYNSNNSFGTINFNNFNGVVSEVMLPPVSSDTVLLAKYDAAGIALWATNMVGAGSNRGMQVSIDSAANIILTGYYATDTVIYNAPNGNIATVITLPPITTDDGGLNAFIIKYSSVGSALWAGAIAGSGTDNRGNSICIDKSDNIIVTGIYNSPTVTVYNGIANNILSPSTYILANYGTTYDTFVVKYADNGMVRWATHITGSSDEIANNITTDLYHNILLAGNTTSDTVTIYNANTAVGATITNITYPARESFIVKLNTEGMVMYTTKNTGVTSGISTDSHANILLTGFYQNQSIDFFNTDGTLERTLFNIGNVNAFVAKYTDYVQNLTLLPCQTLCTKNIILGSISDGNISGGNTLITVCNHELLNQNSMAISGMLLSRVGQTISLICVCDKWYVIANNGTELIPYRACPAETLIKRSTDCSSLL